MKNDIKELYCSYEVSKLLKARDFNIDCKSYYEISLTDKSHSDDGYSGPFGWKKDELNVKYDYNTNASLNNIYDNENWFACSRPTINIVQHWIKENFGIWVIVETDIYGNEWYPRLTICSKDTYENEQLRDMVHFINLQFKHLDEFFTSYENCINSVFLRILSIF